MVDTWTEVADARRIHISGWSTLRKTKPGRVLFFWLRLLTALFFGLSVFYGETAFVALAIVFGLPWAVAESWQNKYEIRPREVVQRSGPLGLFTQRSIPLSAFRSVVCDYDREVVGRSEMNSEFKSVGPTYHWVENSFRVTLEGEHDAFQLASFEDAAMARMLAKSISSRFALELVDLQALPSLDEVREAERMLAEDILLTSSPFAADGSLRLPRPDRN